MDILIEPMEGAKVFVNDEGCSRNEGFPPPNYEAGRHGCRQHRDAVSHSRYALWRALWRALCRWSQCALFDQRNGYVG
jgi:hypothetical protein